MLWRRMLILMAVLAVLVVASTIYQKIAVYQVLSVYSPATGLMSDDMTLDFYPYRWQTAQRERLRALLKHQEHPPTGTDAMSLARYAQYAVRYGNEAAYREGIRRDPRNALYHYLLADHYIKQGITDTSPDTDRTTGRIIHKYQITDRRKLDQGMQELAIGLRLPYNAYHGTIVRAQLAAMPPIRSFHQKIQVCNALSMVLFPEYTRLRHLALVNECYLNQLLSEGKRAEAEPFLHTGERLPVQISNDHTPTLLNQLVALNISTTCNDETVQICRDHGLTREAQVIAARHQVLMGKVAAWWERGRKYDATFKTFIDSYYDATLAHPSERIYSEHAGLLAATLLPTMDTSQQNWVTVDNLAPSRLAEYAVAEQLVIAGVVTSFFLLMLYAGLKAWRGALLLRGKAQPALALTHADWRQIIGVGYLLPLVLYLLYINIPALSGREYGIVRAWIPFFSGIGVTALWMLIVPTSLAAGTLRRQGIAAGMITVENPWKTRVARLGSTLGALIWAGMAFCIVLAPVSLLLLSTINASVNTSRLLFPLACACVVLALPLLPMVWLHSRLATAPHHLALARAMLPVYAVFTLLLGALLPVATAYERYYVQHDKVLGIMVTKEEINVTQVEGAVTLMLRGYINDGARQLHIEYGE